MWEKLQKGGCGRSRTKQLYFFPKVLLKLHVLLKIAEFNNTDKIDKEIPSVVLVLAEYNFTKSPEMGKIHSKGINNEKSACFHHMKGFCTNWAGKFQMER